MGYRFEWDAAKAVGNLKKHGVPFDEAITAFGDPLNVLIPDPDHGRGERRYLGRAGGSGGSMKKKVSRPRAAGDRDTLRNHYDFSKGARGSTAARYARGANVVVIDPAVLDVFPDGAAVNQSLRALAPVLRQQRRRRSA